ncbi:MAG: 3-isopropylmalate dehydrogenase [Gemmatimonadales bacterium]|nr:3-isopropylmalate dehydrogenase [Gemmatimonadales bacterium]
MTAFRVVLLPGDGIGPEVTEQARWVMAFAADAHGHSLTLETHPIGAAAYRQTKKALPPATLQAATRAAAVFLGAVGDPTLTDAPHEERPEAGLLALRKALGAFANLRPVKPYPSLALRSPVRPERLADVDLLVVRELTGGLYFGQPRFKDPDRAVNTMKYGIDEIERIARVAFQAARGRRKKVTSVDKANVLEVSLLWRETVTTVAKQFPDVELEHMLVDTAAMRLIEQPARFDVLLTENLFGDILSDEASVLSGSLGLLPSASVGGGVGLFEPVHGSAPDIAGQGIANPYGAILSGAMLLRHGLELEDAARQVERAVERAIADAVLPHDLGGTATTQECGDAVIARM